MKKYEIGSGFKLIRTTEIKEISATLVEAYHERSGAGLIYLDRPDENKTFAIGFKTVPTDDTGVFHIIEHSVLSGSEKYPVKDPLSELMKSTLYTYVNALTYPDKTLYPVSSKNGKAFLDLISVYMDAVFHPLALKNERIFLSEGHRYEPSEDGTLVPNGVVYNEMKGAYSSPDELAEHYISKLLFSGGTYSHDSGGFPPSVLDLTYEDFLLTHKRFYNPSNSYIFLDGDIDLPSVLALIDAALPTAECGTEVPNITLGSIDTKRRVEYYGIERGEESENRGRLVLGYRGFPHRDLESSLALTAVLDAIADGNTSPLKRPIIASGLCENMYAYYSSGSAVGTLEVQFLNVADGKYGELTELFDSTLLGIIEEGIDSEKIRAALSALEFKTRESDFGAYPRGMVYMSAALEFALLGEDPAAGFMYDSLFSSLRAKIGTGYFTELLAGLVAKERATLELLPIEGLTERNERELNEKAAEYRASLSDAEYEQILEKHRQFVLSGKEPDSEEALYSIPTLSLSDLKEPKKEIETADTVISGTRVLLHTAASAGIVYLDLLFDASDLTVDELSLLKIYLRAMPDLDTEVRSAEDFAKRAKSILGDLNGTLLPVKCGGEVRVYLKYSASMLRDNFDAALELISERLYRTKTDSPEEISRRAKQMLTHSRLSIPEDGTSYAITRTAARYDGYSALRDMLFGYGYHSFLLSFDALCPDAVTEEAKKISLITWRLFRKERLTVAIAAENPGEYTDRIIAAVRTGGITPDSMNIKPLARVNEGIAVPASVSYTACGTSFLPGYTYHGSFSVASSMLLYEHLWGEVRLSGGAYDTGFISRANSGALAAYSYRDPSPMRTVGLFSGLGAKLREIVLRGVDTEKYIISSFGATDTVSTPRSASSQATLLYLSGKSEKDTEKIRREIIETDKERLLAFSDMLGSLAADATYTVVATREELLRMGITNILEI